MLRCLDSARGKFEAQHYEYNHSGHESSAMATHMFPVPDIRMCDILMDFAFEGFALLCFVQVGCRP
jgi:hypothetical protein